ncbi:hypothetical protein A45J_0104 [hot springs metagenome]|uniref:Uncharacterized protein n=1 Tax=hot springs metagenome TaxID=433727 RepID=A0A5J4L266_9ZZZZ
MRKEIFIFLIVLTGLLMGFNHTLFASEKPEIFVQLGLG